MQRLQQHAPLDTTAYDDPGVEDHSGPPLSQGFVLTLINTVASEYCSPETQAMLKTVDPDTWYHGQLLETVLNDFESQDSQLPRDIGKSIYYSLRSQFIAMGLQTPSDVLRTMPDIWPAITRGDSGAWKLRELRPSYAVIDAEQPYNCQFEEGALIGALEAFDAMDVRVEHKMCMRHGDPHCRFVVRWQE